MSRLATLQIIWPPIPSLIFVSMFDWMISFHSMLVTATAFMVYIYVLFAPGLIEVFWKKNLGGDT